MDVQVLVMAKEPLPGRAKTRLTPPLTPAQAAAVARASLEDTLDAVRQTTARRRVLVLDGTFLAPGFDLQPQQTGPLEHRLGDAIDDAWAALAVPVVLVGMDTPQVGAESLDEVLAALLAPGVDAVLGPATDGGWWVLGLKQPRASLVRDVPTSRPDTGARQLKALRDKGLHVTELPVVRDVDTVDDLAPVAAEAPDSRFAAAVRSLLP